MGMTKAEFNDFMAEKRVTRVTYQSTVHDVLYKLTRLEDHLHAQFSNTVGLVPEQRDKATRSVKLLQARYKLMGEYKGILTHLDNQRNELYAGLKVDSPVNDANPFYIDLRAWSKAHDHVSEYYKALIALVDEEVAKPV